MDARLECTAFKIELIDQEVAIVEREKQRIGECIGRAADKLARHSPVIEICVLAGSRYVCIDLGCSDTRSKIGHDGGVRVDVEDEIGHQREYRSITIYGDVATAGVELVEVVFLVGRLQFEARSDFFSGQEAPAHRRRRAPTLCPSPLKLGHYF